MTDSTDRRNSADHILVPGSKRKNRRRPYRCRCEYCQRGKAIEHEPNRALREVRAIRYEAAA